MGNKETLNTESISNMQEISFPAKTILGLLQAHKKAGELPEIKALFQSPGLLKGRQKFLLTEKERVASLGCDINLGIYGKSKDGIDGVWGPATATSTTNYLQWLFDASHPGRLDRVRTKLQARVTNEKGGNKKNSREKAARFLEEARLQVQRQKDEIGVKTKQIVAELKVLEQSTIVNKSEEIDQQIATLGDTIATLTTEAKNLETTFNDEENRIGKLFFAVTLDDKVVVLQETAVEAEKSVIQQLKGKSDLSKVKSILQSTKTQARDKLIISKSYHTFIDEQVKSGKTEDEAKKIAENRLNQAAQVLAMRAFSQQVKQGNTVRSIGEDQFILEPDTIHLLQANEQLQVFESIYEKTVIAQYEIITSKNHLDRKLSVPGNSLFDELTATALYENRDIGKYLFDLPGKSPERIYTFGETDNAPLHQHISTHFFSDKKQSSETSTSQKAPQEKMSSQKASHDEHNQMHQLETELNGYAGKRIRQILLRKSLTTLLDVFDFHDKEAVPLSEKMQVDLSKMELDSDSHSLKYPVRYGSFGTLLMLDGQTGDISIESMLDKMNGKSAPLGLINTASQQSIFGELLQAATLTPDELLRCQSRGELEQYITEKISQKAQEFTTTNLDRTHIAQEMEHQAFLSNRWGFVDGKQENKDTCNPDLEFPTKESKTTSSLLSFLKLCTQGGDQAPLPLAETQQLNSILSDTEFQTGFKKITAVPYGFEQFLLDVDFFSFAQKNRPTNVVKFFQALHEMCKSQVSPDQEEGYNDLKNMLPELPIASASLTTQEGLPNTKYVYEGNQIIIPDSNI